MLHLSSPTSSSNTVNRFRAKVKVRLIQKRTESNVNDGAKLTKMMLATPMDRGRIVLESVDKGAGFQRKRKVRQRT